MKILDFSQGHISRAQALAAANYERQREFTPALPHIDDLPPLDEFAANGLGVAAFDGEDMLGYLCCYSPWDGLFGNVRGTFSPCHANGVVASDSGKIYSYMYQAAAKKWVQQGIFQHCISLYTHDAAAINSFFINGFGCRCVDGIMSPDGDFAITDSSYEYRELPSEQHALVVHLRELNSEHLSHSPCFMPYTKRTAEDYAEDNDDSRIFIMQQNDEVVAYIRLAVTGETFVKDAAGYLHACGAYCLPSHRGNNNFSNLLRYAAAKIKAEGYTHLGVDFESINPAANSFWLKHFRAYTFGLVRRIDERIAEQSSVL